MSDDKQDDNNKEYAEGYARGRSGDFVRDAYNSVWEDRDSQEYKGYVDGERDRDKYGYKDADDCGTGESKSDSACFLTTACAEAMGLGSDCDILNELRAFRDGYVARAPGGVALLREYYGHAPTIVAAVNESERRKQEWAEVYADVQVAVNHIRADAPAAALAVYGTMYQRLAARYLVGDAGHRELS